MLLRWTMVHDISETFFFGIYTVLFVFSTVFVLSKQGRTRTRNLVLAASVAMYVVSATHWAIGIALLVKAASDSNNSVSEIVLTGPLELLAFGYLPSISCVLGDAIVVWRAWVLWERRYDLFIPPILFLIGTIATSVTSAVLTFKGASRDTWQEGDTPVRFGYIIYGLIILTNLWATGLICIRAWQHRRFLRSVMGKSTPKTRAEKALAFLIESGVIYLCFWVTYLVLTRLKSNHGLLIDSAVVVQIIGIYPTVIVVMVTMRLSTADVLESQPSRPEQLAPPPSILFTSRSLQPVSFDSSTSDTSDISSPMEVYHRKHMHQHSCIVHQTKDRPSQ
ncbi:hypothetical protein BC834DRAFT_967516 [Gloeopeniophorella convolvens]|nr:hypothetical protein BC834DRAFT_967516 [Gloeopeniophorella convolvens]